MSRSALMTPAGVWRWRKCPLQLEALIRFQLITSGFVHYTGRSCSTSENSFRIPVSPNSCLEGDEYTEIWAMEEKYGRHGSLCRCTGDKCNNVTKSEITVGKSTCGDIMSKISR